MCLLFKVQQYSEGRVTCTLAPPPPHPASGQSVCCVVMAHNMTRMNQINVIRGWLVCTALSRSPREISMHSAIQDTSHNFTGKILT
jgi:hypothetical protein